MKIYALDHVLIAMPPQQEDKARAFYGEVLGLAEVPKPPELAKRGGVWFEQDTFKLHLGIDPDFRPAKKAHPAFLVESLIELAERCRQFGYDVTPDNLLPGYNRFYIEDPFGNRLELLEPI